MSPPRIGFNAAFYTGKPVGVDRFIIELVRELAPRRELVVYTSVPDAFVQTPVAVRTIPRWTRSQRTRLLWEYTALPNRLRRDRVDLLLAPFSEVPSGIRIPAVAIVHDLIPLTLPGSSPWGYTRLFELSTRRLRAAAIVTISEHARRDILRLGFGRGSPVHVVHLGTRYPCAPGPVRPALPGRFLLYVGGFAPHKNVLLLLQAFARLQSAIPHNLVLVGWAPAAVITGLERTATNLGLADRVRFTGGLSDADLTRLYQTCELFIFPSRYEGFGLPVLEAMACGAPVLCSSATSLPEVGGDAVAYFSPDSEGELVHGIRSLLESPATRGELSRKGVARAAGFTWSRVADTVERIIDQVLSGPGSRVTS